MTTHALTGGFAVCQARLGARPKLRQARVVLKADHGFSDAVDRDGTGGVLHKALRSGARLQVQDPGHRPGEQAIIERILTLRKAGTALDAIADTLNSEGIAPRAGGKWYGSAVNNIVRRAQPAA